MHVHISQVCTCSRCYALVLLVRAECIHRSIISVLKIVRVRYSRRISCLRIVARLVTLAFDLLTSKLVDSLHVT